MACILTTPLIPSGINTLSEIKIPFNRMELTAVSNREKAS